MKYKEWLDVWFANYIEPSSKKKTCERYSEIIEKHLKVKLGEYELEELSPSSYRSISPNLCSRAT